MVDFSRPLELVRNGQGTFIDITADGSLIWETTFELGDINYQFAFKVEIK